MYSACSDHSGVGNDNGDAGVNNNDFACGNGEREGVEECDDGPLNSDSQPDACRTSCRAAYCGDSVIDQGEACDDGPQNNDRMPDSCREICTLPRCGDGVVDPSNGETCDCGTAPATLPSRCSAVNGDLAGTCSGNCQAIYCGNGITEPEKGEECDPGDPLSGDGCGPTCLIERCGNGFIDPGEACDLGEENSLEPDALCRPDCTPRRCGDGVRDPVLSEGCDASALNSDVPDAACRTNCQPRRCGDGVRDSDEICDDGNVVSGDACSGDCQSRETCGNGYVDAAYGEECDDANLRSHDGCSSGCTRESLMWVKWLPPLQSLPDPKMVYDSVRQRLVLYGGAGVPGVLGQTWEYDGAGWSQVSTANAPLARTGYALAYDSARQSVVLFGGNDYFGVKLAETWEYDGVAWVKRSPAVSPERRVGHAVAYDSVRQKLVLFGGQPESSYWGKEDTWEYDGTTWTQKFPAVSPPYRLSHAMAYNPDRQRVVASDGAYGPTWSRRADHWEFDGNTWTPLPGATQPPARTGHHLTYDTTRHRLVLFGGNPQVGIPGMLNDTWEHDGTGWSQVTPATSPSARVGGSLAFAGAWGAMLYGGSSAAGALSELWSYDGANWTQLHVVEPEARAGAALTYDSDRDRVVLFGGRTQDLRLPTDTWEFDGRLWRHIPTPHSPPGRRGPPLSMAYDNHRKRVVLFGGWDAPSRDTWEYDGADWTQRFPAHSPDDLGSMAYDERRQVMVLRQGGFGPQDTWEYDGADWREVIPLANAPGRRYHSLTYDSDRGLVVMNGGAASSDMWEYDGSRWVESLSAPHPWGMQVPLVYDRHRRSVVHGNPVDPWEYHGGRWKPLPVSVMPSARGDHAMAYQAPWIQTILFGGVAGQVVGETWLLRYMSSWPEEWCGENVDADGDGLVGCADPDCKLHSSCQGGEVCNNGTDDDGDGLVDCLDPSCVYQACGAPGYTCRGWTCQTCGDGDPRSLFREECDDGNTVNGDGCSGACTVEGCGDGLLQPGLGETCEDGNTMDNDGCDASCGFPCAEGTGAFRALVDPQSGHCLASYSRTMTWQGAEAFCNAQGGHLVTIEDSAKHSLVLPLLNPRGTWSWIGLSDLASTGDWAWTSGEPTTYLNFSVGQPSGGEHCVHIWTSVGEWNDLPCASLLPFYCEVASWPSGCGNGVVDADETCDDGNRTSGDGCSWTCAIEPAYTCSGQPSACQPYSLRYDVTADFSDTTNPNGVWRYGWVSTPGDSLHLFDQANANVDGVHIWQDSTVTNSPGLWKNTYGDGYYGAALGQICLHPGAAGGYSVLRFTAPAAGICLVDATFFSGHSGETDGTILQNGALLQYFPSTTVNPQYSATLTLAIGDMLDFAVGYLGDWNSDTTPLDVLIRCP